MPDKEYCFTAHAYVSIGTQFEYSRVTRICSLAPGKEWMIELHARKMKKYQDGPRILDYDHLWSLFPNTSIHRHNQCLSRKVSMEQECQSYFFQILKLLTFLRWKIDSIFDKTRCRDWSSSVEHYDLEQAEPCRLRTLYRQQICQWSGNLSLPLVR